jgi:hypothetical protein
MAKGYVQRRIASMPRLRDIRETQLGWEVTDIVAKCNGRPSVPTVYRLEQGLPIRLASVTRIFEIVNAGLRAQGKAPLTFDQEVKTSP